MGIKAISKADFDKIIKIKFDKILEGFDKFNYVELYSRKDKEKIEIEEDFIKTLESFFYLNYDENKIIVDFYKNKLDKDSIEFIENNLDLEEIKIFNEILNSGTINDMFFEIEKNVQEFGLNISEFGVLEMLYHKGDQPVQKVAEKILVTSGTITYVINKLEKKELVVRRKCEKDKRIFYVSLTEKGREFISDIFPKHKEFLDNLFIELNEDTKRELVDNLIQLRKILKE